MANCCANSFYSETLNAPDCSVPCISSATPGAIFVGADGSVYILTGSDPCVLADWTSMGSCCLSFTNLTDTTTICCNEELVITSSDGSIGISVNDVTGIDFTASLTFTFEDDYGNSFETGNASTVTLSDNNGIVVEIIADGQFRISGNSYSGAGVPGITPTHATMPNYYLDTTNNVLYVWKLSASAWVRINYLPLPVSMFTYTKSALAASLNGAASTSTQNGTTLTYQWTGSGPAAVVFGTPTASSTTATFSVPGAYTITLTVTDSNGATKAFSEFIDIEPQDECDVKFEIPSSAFADVNNPLDSEVDAWITANGPFNNRTLLYYVGSGTDDSPDYVWFYTC